MSIPAPKGPNNPARGNAPSVHVRDPIESALDDLVYLRFRIDVLERLARHSAENPNDLYASIAQECRYLLARVDQIRQTLDPESKS